MMYDEIKALVLDVLVPKNGLQVRVWAFDHPPKNITVRIAVTDHSVHCVFKDGSASYPLSFADWWGLRNRKLITDADL